MLLVGDIAVMVIAFAEVKVRLAGAHIGITVLIPIATTVFVVTVPLVSVRE